MGHYEKPRERKRRRGSIAKRRPRILLHRKPGRRRAEAAFTKRSSGS
jgi:hypothetical protein